MHFQSEPIRNLGVMYDKHLKMGAHISSVVKSTTYHTRNIGRIRKYLTIDSTKKLVNSLVTSRIDYCNSQLAGIAGYQVKRLQKVQNYAARVVLQLPKSIAPDLSELHWLPVKYRIDFKIAVLTFKSIHGLAPVYLQELLKPFVSSRTLRSKLDCNLLTVPRSHHGSGDRSSQVYGPIVWNGLPADVRACRELYPFKKLLKTAFYRRALNSNCLLM